MPVFPLLHFQAKDKIKSIHLSLNITPPLPATQSSLSPHTQVILSTLPVLPLISVQTLLSLVVLHLNFSQVM